METKQNLIRIRLFCVAVLVLTVAVLAKDSCAENAAASGIDGIPHGYQLVTATDFGKKLVTHKAGSASVSSALKAALADLSGYFDAMPINKGIFINTKDRRQGVTPFTTQLRGESFQGLIFCTADGTGADFMVVYCRADKLASDWIKLISPRSATKASAAANVKTSVYAFPDGTGTIQLPAGWRTTAQTGIKPIHIQGPAGQRVAISLLYNIYTPNSWLVQEHFKSIIFARQHGFAPPKPLEILVSPYVGPVDALIILIPQMSQISQSKGGPATTLNRILEPPKPVTSGFRNGQAALVYYAFTQTMGGVSTQYRARAKIDTYITGDTWSLFGNEAVAPDATFDQDLPVMAAIMNSLNLDPQSMQRATDQEIAGQNRIFQAQQNTVAAQQKNFNDYLGTIQNNQRIFNRSCDDFDEVIRGSTQMKNPITGETHTVPLSSAKDIVTQLNEHGGQWVLNPSRDMSDPLPGQ